MEHSVIINSCSFELGQCSPYSGSTLLSFNNNGNIIINAGFLHVGVNGTHLGAFYVQTESSALQFCNGEQVLLDGR